MSFESKITPDRVQATHIKEGFVMGWIPGEIVSLDDPEKIGRIQVRCPLLSESSNMPNEEDSWVWVTEMFTGNGVPGGSQSPLSVGSLVALIPMFGDPEHLLMFGCIANRQDRPHPDFDRSRGVTGTASPGGTIEISNDQDGSHFKSFPSKAVQSVAGDGSIMYQSPGKARFHLMQDGGATLENDNASLTTSPEGNLTARSLGGAAMNLNQDGTLTIACAEKSTLSLNSKNANLEGPLRHHSRLLKEAKGFLSADLKQGVQLLKNLEKLINHFESGEFGASHFIYEADVVLKRLRDGVATNLPKGMAILEELKDAPPIDLGESLDGQIKEGLRIELDKIVKVAEESVEKDKPGAAIVADVVAKIPEELKKLLAVLDAEEKKALFARLDAIIPTIDALAYDVVLQREALIAEIAPNGWHSIDAIVKMRLHGKLKSMEAAINPKPERLEKFTIKEEGEWWEDLPDRVESAIGQLGEYSEFAKGDLGIYDLHEGDENLTEQAISRVFSSHALKSSKYLTKEELADKDREAKQIEEDKKTTSKLVAGESPLSTLLGEVTHNLIKKTEKTLSIITGGEKSTKGIAPLQTLAFLLTTDDVIFNQKILIDPLKEVAKHFSVGGVTEGDILAKSVEEVLPKACKELINNLVPVLESAIEDFSKLIRAVPDEPKGARITARESFVQMETSRGDKGAVARIGKEGAQLMGPEFAPNLRVSMFADKAEGGMSAGPKGGGIRVERRMAEVLGPERKDGELPEREEDKPGKGKKGGYKLFSEGQRRKQGGEQEKATKKPKYDDLEEEERMVRTSLFADGYGGAGTLSGGRGAGSIVHLEKAETFGPEIELDGKKLRTGSFVFAQEAGSEAADGAISYVARDRAEVLGPEREEGEFKDEQDDAPVSDKDGFDFDLKSVKFKKGGDREEGKKGKFADAEAKKKLRTCLFADRKGLVGGKSGGDGACFSADETKSGMHGPAIEIKGEKTRSGMQAAPEETAMFAPGEGAMTVVGANRAEMLAPVRDDAEQDDDDYEPPSDFAGFKFTPFVAKSMEKGGESKEKELEKPKESKLRSSMCAEKNGTVSMKSGGEGACSFVDPAKAGILGPAIEKDGKKVRTEMFAWENDIGMKGAGEKAAISYVSEKIGELLGPQVKDAIGELIRTNIFADEKSATVWAGGKEGAMTVVTQELAKMLGPSGKGLLEMVKTYSQLVGADGVSKLKLAEKVAELLGPDGKKAMQIGMDFVKLLGPGGSQMAMAEAGLKLLGIDGKSGIQMLGNVTKLLGPGGKIALSLSPKKLLSKGLGGMLSMGGSGTSLSSIGTTVFRNGSEDGSKGVGVLLDPKSGLLSLSSFFSGDHNKPPVQDDNDDDDDDKPEEPVQWDKQAARFALQGTNAHVQSFDEDGTSCNEVLCTPEAVYVQGKQVIFRALSDPEEVGEEPEILHEFKINEDGVFVNGVNLSVLSDLQGSIGSILARLLLLESPSGSSS